MAHSRTAVLAVLLTLAACGGDRPAADRSVPADTGTAAAAAWNGDICAGVTQDELLQFTGRSWAPGQVTAAQPNMYRCAWSPLEGEGGITLTAHLVEPDDAMKMYSSLPGLAEVDGPGDATWWSDAVQTYVVRYGGRLLVVGFASQDGSHVEHARRIAERAMERL